jgi:hypothetical protein
VKNRSSRLFGRYGFDVRFSASGRSVYLSLESNDVSPPGTEANESMLRTASVELVPEKMPNARPVCPRKADRRLNCGATPLPVGDYVFVKNRSSRLFGRYGFVVRFSASGGSVYLSLESNDVSPPGMEANESMLRTASVELVPEKMPNARPVCPRKAIRKDSDRRLNCGATPLTMMVCSVKVTCVKT